MLDVDWYYAVAERATLLELLRQVLYDRTLAHTMHGHHCNQPLLVNQLGQLVQLGFTAEGFDAVLLDGEHGPIFCGLKVLQISLITPYNRLAVVASIELFVDGVVEVLLESVALLFVTCQDQDVLVSFVSDIRRVLQCLLSVVEGVAGGLS